MKILTFFLIKVPHKIYRIIRNIVEYSYYQFFYLYPRLDVDFTPKKYLLCGNDNLDSIADNYRKIFPENTENKIIQADLICEHVFDLLGSGPKKLSPEGDGYQPIDWHCDFKSGYKWDSKTFYKNIQYGHQKGVDVKVPWELSRFQHLTVLGQAYVLTENKKYAEEFKNQITDWINNNSVGCGVNWACTMDVAIRAANWLVGLEYFTESDLLSQDFVDKLYSSVYEHGKFIRGHLEYSSTFTSNHYLADIAGLFFIAVYCPFFKESERWISFCKKELENEMQKQVYPDGCDFEASTSYHRLVLEMFFYCEILSRKVGIEFSESYKSRLRKMFEFSLYCIKPNGFIPQIGDNDSGRFLIFSKRPVLEHKYLLNFASIYYRDSDFKLSKFNFDEEAFWALGFEEKNLYDNLPIRKEPLKSKSFPDAGWYIMRHNNGYCFISCGQNGQNGNGGHAHNDKLSFELMLNCEDVVVDPGTYAYTPYPEERNRFRSTGYHNTVKFEEYEQNRTSRKDLFTLPDRTSIRKAELKDVGDSVVFQAEIQYLKFSHNRTISFDKKANSWQITDKISSSKQQGVKVIFHLAPDVFYDEGDIISKETNKSIASIRVKGHEIRKEDYDYSPQYGEKIKSERLVVDIIVKNDTQPVNTYIDML